jgi:hypothetical protein
LEEVIISAIIGEVASRSISFVIETCSKRMVRPSTVEAKLGILQRLLLRVGAVVEDAGRRLITNQAMRQEMYRVMEEVLYS